MKSKGSVARKERRYSAKIERSLISIFNQATPEEMAHGRNWYRHAHSTAAQIALRHGLKVSQTVGVIAALSPSRHWDANVADARVFIASYADGNRGAALPKVGTYGQSNRDKAESILNGTDPLAVLGGLKVTAFFTNMLTPEVDDKVTIDRHAKSAAYGVSLADADATLGTVEYRAMVRQYKTAAGKVGMLANEFQAIVWVVWRRMKGINDAVEVSA